MIDAVPDTGPSVVVADGESAERARLASLADTELLDTDLLDTPAEEGFDRITRLAQSLFGVSTVSMAVLAHDRHP